MGQRVQDDWPERLLKLPAAHGVQIEKAGADKKQPAGHSLNTSRIWESSWPPANMANPWFGSDVASFGCPPLTSVSVFQLSLIPSNMSTTLDAPPPANMANPRLCSEVAAKEYLATLRAAVFQLFVVASKMSTTLVAPSNN
jgi:hypothetical protein